MSEEGQGNEYELSPPTPPEPVKPKPKPGDPDWVEPVPIIEKADPEPASAVEEEPVDPDVQQHRAAAILAYIFFVIPLVLAPNSKYARFHANQGLILFIFWWVTIIAVVVLHFGWALLTGPLGSIGVLWVFFGCVFHLVPVALVFAALALTLQGIINAANGDFKGLPLLGHWTLIK